MSRVTAMYGHADTKEWSTIEFATIRARAGEAHVHVYMSQVRRK